MNKEIKTILIASLVLAFVFGFDDNLLVFNLPFYLTNLIKFFILSFIALIIHNKVQKYYSNRVGATTEISLWASKSKLKLGRYTPKKQYSFPTGILMPILISFLSVGQLFFAATTSLNVKVNPAYRMGRKFVKLTEFEYAKIAASAPIVHILIAIVVSFIDVQLLQDFGLVNTMIALSTMLPLPGLLGITVFFSSKPLYIFSLTFILVAGLLLTVLSSLFTLLLAIAIALATLIAYLWKFYS